MPKRKSRPHRATMVDKISLLLRLAVGWFFAKVTFGPRRVASIREANERGRLVYVMQSRSLFDQLYFNYAFLERGLPLARWSNGIRTTFLRPFFRMLRDLVRRRDRRTPKEQLADTLHADDAALLFLERPLDTDAEKRAFSGRHLENLLEIQREDEAAEGDEAQPIVLLPIMVLWERRSEHFRPSVLDDVFGSRHSPGFFRKIVHVIKNIWQPFFMMGAPIVELGTPFTIEDIDDETDIHEDAESLRRELARELEEQRTVVVGPKFKNGAVLKREILADPLFVDEATEIGREQGLSGDAPMEQAKENLDRIAADFSLLTIKFMAVVLSPIWQLIYDGLEVDEEGLERVRDAARDHRIVVVPSHKSHVDYLTISHIFYHAGLLPPHIVAGDNLDFFPVGSIFRRSGAFFIRRSFRDDPLYGFCLTRYIAKLLEEGYPIEFFIEGGRSRTGKLLTPRFGILRMMIEGFIDYEQVKGLKIVPCNVTYERIVEGRAHQKEVVGGEKKQENLGALLRSTRVLTSKYGRLYITFGKLLDVGEYLHRYDVTQGSSDDEVARLTQRLGYRVIYEINKAGTVTPSALTCLAILNNPTRGLGRARLRKVVGFVLDMFLRKGVRLSPSVQTALASKRAQLKGEGAPTAPDDAGSLAFLDGAVPRDRDDRYELLGRAVSDLVDETINLFSDGKLIEVTKVRGGEQDTEEDRYFYSVPEESRGELSYYKNMVVHTFVPEALLSAALIEPGRARMGLESLKARTLFLSKLFKYEFFYEERAEFENVFWRTFDEFAERDWVHAARDHVGPVHLEEPSPALQFFRNLVLTFLETYTLAAKELRELGDGWMDRSDFVDHLLVTCRMHYHEGRVRFHESLAKPTFTNALKRFADWGYIEQRKQERRRKRVSQLRLAPDPPDAGGHEALLYRLRCILRTRPRVVEAGLKPPEGLDAGRIWRPDADSNHTPLERSSEPTDVDPAENTAAVA